MRDILPPYLVHAIDYVTGGYVPGAPSFAREDEADDVDDGEVGGMMDNSDSAAASPS